MMGDQRAYGDIKRIDLDESNVELHGTDLPFRFGRVTVCHYEGLPAPRINITIAPDEAYAAKRKTITDFERDRWTMRRVLSAFFGLPRSWAP